MDGCFTCYNPKDLFVLNEMGSHLTSSDRDTRIKQDIEWNKGRLGPLQKTVQPRLSAPRLIEKTDNRNKIFENRPLTTLFTHLIRTRFVADWTIRILFILLFFILSLIKGLVRLSSNLRALWSLPLTWKEDMMKEKKQTIKPALTRQMTEPDYHEEGSKLWSLFESNDWCHF